MALDDTICIAPLESSLEPSLFSNACSPFLSARSYSFDLLLQIGHFLLHTRYEFTHATVIIELYAVEWLGPLWRTDSLG